VKSKFSLMLIVFVTFSFCLLGSGCCGVVAPGNVALLSGKSQTTVTVMMNWWASCSEPLKIQKKKALDLEWDLPEPMTLIDAASRTYQYCFTHLNEDWQYRVIDGNGRSVRNGGPFTISVDDANTEPYKNGYESALNRRNEEIRPYRLVIELEKWRSSPSGDMGDEFLHGFKAAYAETSDTALGEKYADILNQSLKDGFYEQAFQQGQKHVKGQATDAGIQELIRRSLGLSRGFALGWKAGYIEGFVEAMLETNPEYDEEGLYQQAETMYDALRRALGL